MMKMKKMKKMMRTMKNNLFISLLPAFVMIVGCDYVDSKELRKERADRIYQTAMSDYQAGRLNEAVKGLEEVCKKDPANASARFQYACLLQDYKKEIFAAACAYREYINLRPGSDKTKLAEDRFNECERLLAEALVKKYSLGSADENARQLSDLKNERDAALKKSSALEQEVAALKRQLTIAQAENERFKSIFEDETESSNSSAENLAAAKQLLDDEDAQASNEKSGIESAKALLKEEDEMSAPILSQSADAKNRRSIEQQKKREEEARKKAERASSKPAHPDVYLVQEGDTLYKIAVKFYGHSSAWVRIREANKAVISTDGRVYAGQTIKLPK